MFDNLVTVLAIAAAVPLVLTAVPRLPVPGAVLEIVADIVLGPDALGLVSADQTVVTLSTVGLAFLLFLAGLDIDLEHLRGQRARLAAASLLISFVLSAAVGLTFQAAGLVDSGLLVGIVLLATSLGLVVPVLRDSGASERPVGQLVIAGASLDEICAIVLLSLFFSEQSARIGPKLLLALLAVLAVLLVAGLMRAEGTMWFSTTIARLADTSAQIRVRLTILLVVGMGAVAAHLGFETILGAFIAGGILRLADPMAPPAIRSSTSNSKDSASGSWYPCSS